MTSSLRPMFLRLMLLPIAALLLSNTHAFGNDRFIVPVPDSPPPSSSSSSSSSGSSSSSSDSGSSSSSSSGSSYSSGTSSGSSYSSSSNDSYRDSGSSSGRFIVPVPRDRPHHDHPGPAYGGGGGGTYYGGGPYWDDYWGGCYYFGGQYYYWGGYYYSPFRGAYGRILTEPDYFTRTYTHRADPGRLLPIFFPPDPPPLGSPTPPPPPQRPYLTAPIELADYVAEPFYAPLSTRLAKGNLTNALRTRLDAYLANKRTLEAALRNRLGTLASVDPATRLRELTAFAQQQTPGIAATERAAEQLRHDLLRPGLVGALWGSGDWNEHREWHLGSGRLSGAREHSLALEFQVVRAAAFYQEGLSPAQRRLLRELAMELQVQAYAPAGATSAATDDGVVYFSPETARVRFPTNISADLSGKIASYTKQKSGLKDELHDAIYRLDSATPAHRTTELRRLASAQAPRVAALEELAEDIRRELAATHGAESLAQQEVPSDYNDYKAAVLEPGLSPEQRRLLFAAALRDLRLPLPGGELQP